MAHHDIKAPRQFEVPTKFKVACIVLFVVGFLTFGIASFVDVHVAWNGYLMGFWFSLCLGLAGPFINSTQFLSIAGWSVSVRRVGEAMGAFIPVSLFFFFGLIFGAPHLYHWWDPAYVAADPILAKKTGMLNATFFALTGIGSLVVLSAVSFWKRKISLEQDEGRSGKDYGLQKAVSAIFLVCFVIGFSMLTWTTTMSLEPHWFSTMWSVYLFAALFQTGLAFMIIVVLYLMKNDYFGDFVGTKQIHDLGKLFFGFTVFYAYIGFCQFLLIWYANIPEEGIWYVARGMAPDVTTGWEPISLALPFVKFIIPFLILLPQAHKKNKNNILLYVAWGIIVLQVFEIWYWIAPTPHEKGVLASTLALPIGEVLITLGFVGAFGFVFLTALSRANLIPVKAPFLHESIEHHHHGVKPPKPEQITIS